MPGKRRGSGEKVSKKKKKKKRRADKWSRADKPEQIQGRRSLVFDLELPFGLD